jgi:hypothetical protein
MLCCLYYIKPLVVDSASSTKTLPQPKTLLDITLMQHNDENSDYVQNGQKRAGALHIGLRKKP